MNSGEILGKSSFLWPNYSGHGNGYEDMVMTVTNIAIENGIQS